MPAVKIPIIAIDIDDVLAASVDHMREVANELTGLDLKEHHFAVPGPYWGYHEHVLSTNGVADKESHERILKVWISRHSEAEPIRGAIEAITKLSKNYKIVLVTARDPSITEDTEKWLKKHFDGLYEDLHVIGYMKVVETPKSKGEVCVEIGAKWLIDDNPQHCLSAVEHGVETILFGDYGWHHDAPKSLHKCRDWPAVLEYFNA